MRTRVSSAAPSASKSARAADSWLLASRAAGSVSARRRPVRRSPSSAARHSRRPDRAAGGKAGVFGHLGPVAVDGVEVRPSIAAAARRVDGRVQIRSPGAAGCSTRRRGPGVRLLPRPPDRPRRGNRHSRQRIGQRRHVLGEARIDPRRAVRGPTAHVLGIDGQAFAQDEAGRRRERGQRLDPRPRTLRVHVIRCDRGDATPVVDARPQQESDLTLTRVTVGGQQVGRGLDPRLRAEHKPGHGDRGREVVELGVRMLAHGRVRLRAEVLDDHFLDVPVLARNPPDGVQRLGPLGQVLSDADQNSGRERNGNATGVGEHPQPYRRFLVGGTEVRLAGSGPKPLRCRLQHHAHARGDGLEPVQVRPGQDARVEVRQQAGLLEYGDRRRPQIIHCGVIAPLAEPLPRHRPALLRTVAQREQRLLAPLGRTGPGDGQHLLAIEERGRKAVRNRGECAVVTPVAAQPRQRNEHLLRVRDHARP